MLPPRNHPQTPVLDESEAQPKDETSTAASRTSESGQLVSSLKLANCADRHRTKLRTSLRSLSASAHSSVAGGGICIPKSYNMNA